MSKTKVVYIVSDIDKSLHFEWIALPLQKNYDLLFILIGPEKSFLAEFLQRSGIRTQIIKHKRKQDLISTWISVWRILKKERPQIVHTHLWIANVVGLTAAWLLRVPKRIFTRHHGTIHHQEFPSGLKWDRLCNFVATDIIAISENVKNILVTMDGARAEKITMIHHGFDLQYFSEVEVSRVDELRRRLNLPAGAAPKVGVISRFVAWKGIQYIIPAFEKILDRHPAAVIILANASGGYEREIRQLLERLPKSSYRLVRFEADLAALYKLFDVMVHVPVDAQAEAFGQTYVEPLIASVPSVFTLSGIAAEFVQNGQNALVVDFKNSSQIFEQLSRLISDKELQARLIENGRKSADRFAMSNYLDRLNLLYRS